MLTLSAVCEYLETLAPPVLAAEWDNVGLLVGDRSQRVTRLLTCLTVTPAVAAEAIRLQADLIVTHHPLPFRPLKRLTADEPTGRLLLDLIRAGIAVYSPHTAFDSARLGINQRLAEGLGLIGIEPLLPHVPPRAAEREADAGAGDNPAAGGVGTGRVGRFEPAITLGEAAARLKRFVQVGQVQIVGHPRQAAAVAAVACGSAGELLDAAIRRGCDLFVTGEARLHTCYEAQARRCGVLLAGHYASERFGIERLAEALAAHFADATVWASREETDPLAWL